MQICLHGAACMALPGGFRRPCLERPIAGLRGSLRAWSGVPAEREPVKHELRVPVQVPDCRRDRLAVPEDEAGALP